MITLLSCCSSPLKQTEEEAVYKEELSSTIYKVRNEDSLRVILHKFIDENNVVGKMLCYKSIGLRQRESARFSEAIKSHQQGLDLALQLKDT
ncbi:MAG: hypothetical protein KBH29_09835, partial [Lutibacter sp.]|nr:hypothetical protein [Lutibacter sp.]